MASTVPAVLTALTVALQARPALAGVQVTSGAPFPVPEPEWIWLADVAGTEESAALGSGRRDEFYGITTVIRCVTSGVDDVADDASVNRVYTLRDEIAEQLRPAPIGDPTVGGLLIWALMGGDGPTITDKSNPRSLKP